MSKLIDVIPPEILQKHIEASAEEASRGCRHNEGGPFGAVIVDKEGKEIARGHNMVLATNDPSAHAEITAIRNAASSLKRIDLSGFLLVTSCEPCPMCLSAICEAKIGEILYGATRGDAANINFSDDDIYEIMKKYRMDKPEVKGDWVRVKRSGEIKKEMVRKFGDKLWSTFGIQIEDTLDNIAIIEKEDKLVAVGFDKIDRKKDPTAHAAISAIQYATATWEGASYEEWKNGFDLTGFDMYLNYTPCPLCFAAIHWARISNVYCGMEPELQKGADFSKVLATIRDDENMSLIEKHQLGRTACLVPFREWEKRTNKTTY